MENISNTSTVQAERVEKVYSNSGMYRAIIVFLVFFLIVIVLLVVGVVKRLSYIPEDVASVILETVVCDSCNAGEDELLDSQTSLQNEGWSLHEYPDYGFSIELPSYSYFNPSIEDKSLIYAYVWSVRSYDSVNTNDEEALEEGLLEKELPYFSKSIGISSKPMTEFPDEEEYILDCGGNCYDFTAITVNFYENKEQMTLDEIDEIFNSDCAGEETIYESSISAFNGLESLEYTCEYLVATNSGTIILTDEYIVEIVHGMLSSEYETGIQAQKILDSMKFR